ncbi:RNA polymerase sigma factor [Enterocloster clostridioformis]|uniref:RNA polymerase sigma factor n=1 Tax=Enterocloster clostridioformis TaxID=1531 RepID=UPI0014098EBF|nr:sigma-70 family RNA polymerase sigma factor [Enterocloster clostridioformis]
MDVKQIETAFETYWDKLYRVALIMLKNEYDAEDAVQDTFIKYMTKAPVFREREHEKAWVLKVGMNICKNKIRFHSLHPAIDIDSIEISGHQKEDEVLITSLVGLPDKYKEVVLLYYIEGYSCKEVGKILRLTESTVKKRLERGRNLLKKELGEE